MTESAMTFDMAGAPDRCQSCQTITPIHLLDAKPKRYRKARGKVFWPRICEHLMETGEDFDWLECEACYGPAFVKGDETS